MKQVNIFTEDEEINTKWKTFCQKLYSSQVSDQEEEQCEHMLMENQKYCV